jgi:hypothetical protein
MNPAPPNLHATIKLHKPNSPIRSIINWKKASAYELAKDLTQALRNYIHLPYTCNICNSITDLKTIEINKDTRICSFDIENMCTNVSKIDPAIIIINVLKINPGINESIQNEIVHVLKTAMKQNYFNSNRNAANKQTD